MTYRVSPSDPVADHETILDLWRRNLPGADAARFAWLYEQGPTVGLVLRSDDEVVGSAGLMRRTMRVLGRDQEVVQAVDLNVDRKHRTIGPALALQRAVIEMAHQSGWPVIYGFPNPQSKAVLLRGGYRELGCLGRWIKPLSTRKLSRRLPRWLTTVADVGLHAVARETYRRIPAGLRAARIGRFDERFDRLFEVAAAWLPIVGHRTAEYLNWRYSRRTPSRHHVLGLLDQNDRLRAYVIWGWRRGTASVSDLLADEPAHLEILLAALMRRLRRRRTDSVVFSYLGHPDVCTLLTRLGFWPRALDWKALLHVAPELSAADVERWMRPENWYLTRADFDTDE
jgi:hypothetical protein